MAHETIRGKSKQTLNRGRVLLSKTSIEHPDQANEKREQFLAMLKKRHGYTNEIAVDELKRLLKQFYSINRRLGIQRVWPSFKHPDSE